MAQKGLLIVISGPSGTGKGSVCKALMEQYQDLHFSISVTTRQPRPGEQEGVNYYFINKAQFEEMIEKNELIEWAQVYGNYYGTPRSKVNEMLKTGKNVILEIDTQGAMKVKRSFTEGVFIFLLPPSLQELSERIHKRGTDSEDVIQKRLKCAVQEIDCANEYDYILVNDNIELATRKIMAILTAEACRAERTQDVLEQLKAEPFMKED